MTDSVPPCNSTTGKHHWVVEASVAVPAPHHVRDRAYVMGRAAVCKRCGAEITLAERYWVGWGDD